MEIVPEVVEVPGVKVTPMVQEEPAARVAHWFNKEKLLLEEVGTPIAMGVAEVFVRVKVAWVAPVPG